MFTQDFRHTGGRFPSFFFFAGARVDSENVLESFDLPTFSGRREEEVVKNLSFEPVFLVRNSQHKRLFWRFDELLVAPSPFFIKHVL